MSRVAVVCRDGHPQLPIEAFVTLSTGEWRRDNEPKLPKLGDVDEKGIPRDYGTEKRAATFVSPEGARKIAMTCPRCGRNVSRGWEPWTAALEDLADAGVSVVSLGDVERYSLGKRGTGRG